jgi:PadR family transcriptional regulator
MMNVEVNSEFPSTFNIANLTEPPISTTKEFIVIRPRDHLGRFEHFLLLAVLRLGDDAYGMTIRRELARHTGREVAVGAIYTALARLEARGLVQSWLGEPTPERGGRAKRYYRVLAAGKKAVAKTQSALMRLSGDLEQT